jgi:sugar O-acyltransferase (sialic acid O-acetyltransferase NeuD family)
MDSIVVFGAGKIADVFWSSAQAGAGFKIAAFTVDRPHLPAEPIRFGLPVVPFDQIEAQFPAARFGMFVALGYHGLNALRAERQARAKAMGYRLVSHVDARGTLAAGAAMGENCFIMDGASVQAGSRLEDGAFVWSGAVVGHHSHVGAHAWLAANTTIGGGATIGERSFLGLAATIGHEVSLGARSFVGAGTLITRSTADDGVYITPDTERFRLDSARFMKITAMR